MRKDSLIKESFLLEQKNIDIYRKVCCELPPLIPTGLKWGLLIEFPLKAIPAVPAVLLIL